MWTRKLCDFIARFSQIHARRQCSVKLHQSMLRAFANRIFNWSLDILFIGAALCLALLLHPKFLKSSVFPAPIDMSFILMQLGSDKSNLLYFYGKRLAFEVLFFLPFSFVSLKSFFLVAVYKDIPNTSYMRTIVFPLYLEGSC